MSIQNIILPVVVGGLFYLGGQYIASEPGRVQQEEEAGREITVTGQGEVSARPDVARITLGVATGPQASAPAALQQLTSRFEKIVAQLEQAGIDEKDIKTTNLSINPLYNYNDGRQELRGYEASESVRVTIRALETIGDVLARATADGVNQAGGVVFEIDDPELLQREAQVKAIANARENAETLAKALGVRLGRVKTFTASAGAQPPVFARAELGLAEDAVGGPPVPVGEEDVTSVVQVTFELK